MEHDNVRSQPLDPGEQGGVVVKKFALALLPLVFLGGCDQINAYAWDPRNLTIMGVFVGLLVLFFIFISFVGRPEAKAEQIKTTRQERAWLQELSELRNGFVQAQQAVLDRCMELMTEKQKEDQELKRLRLKAH